MCGGVLDYMPLLDFGLCVFFVVVVVEVLYFIFISCMASCLPEEEGRKKQTNLCFLAVVTSL